MSDERPKWGFGILVIRMLLGIEEIDDLVDDAGRRSMPSCRPALRWAGLAWTPANADRGPIRDQGMTTTSTDHRIMTPSAHPRI